jgi:hypothetical protein
LSVLFGLASSFVAASPLVASLKDGATNLGGGWLDSPWFGVVYDAGNNWLYNADWGWLYEFDGGTGGAWFYASDEEGWFWADEETYPAVYRYADAAWVTYWEGTTDPRLYHVVSPDSWLASDGSDGALWHDYFTAIVDAETAEYSEISHSLIAVNQYNEALPWNEEHTKIRVMSWMSGKYISSYVVGSDLTPTWEMWVTVSGEAQTAAQASGLSGDALALRMKQYIGLPPDGAYAYWVEFWVKPGDLYRPSADPDPSDREAEIDFSTAPEMSVSEDYIAWYESYAEGSYHLSRNGYPWTRLGYTYDWNSTSSEVGFSEFVIRPGSTVTITGVYTNAEYLEGN